MHFKNSPSHLLCFSRQVSTTTTQSGIVMEVCATFVLRTIFTFDAKDWKILFCS